MAVKPAAKPGREKLYVEVPSELAERIRDAVYFSRGTLQGFAASALEEHLGREERRNRGPFPSRGGRALRTGRPMKRPTSAARA